VEREDVIRLDVEGDRLPLGRGFPPFGARHNWVAAAGQAHVQEGVGAQFLDQQHLAAQFSGAVREM
jgi:hypothetical protein